MRKLGVRGRKRKRVARELEFFHFVLAVYERSGLSMQRAYLHGECLWNMYAGACVLRVGQVWFYWGGGHMCACERVLCVSSVCHTGCGRCVVCECIRACAGRA